VLDSELDAKFRKIRGDKRDEDFEALLRKQQDDSGYPFREQESEKKAGPPRRARPASGGKGTSVLDLVRQRTQALHECVYVGTLEIIGQSWARFL